MKKIVLTVAILIVIAASVLFYFLKSRPAKEAPIPLPIEPELPKVAFVIDDLGYNLSNLGAIIDLNIPVTFSILPNLAYSERIAAEAGLRGYEVILHLPLEPHEDDEPMEKATVLCDMEPDAVIRELERAMMSVPGLIGISNHMGSRATEDRRLMSIIFERAKKDNLFFMDSKVTSDSICEETASDVGIGFVERSVFLDNESDIDYIKKQIKKLGNKALRDGSAVGVGHDRPLTIMAIKEMVKEMREKGIDFVFLSDLVKKK